MRHDKFYRVFHKSLRIVQILFKYSILPFTDEKTSIDVISHIYCFHSIQAISWKFCYSNGPPFLSGHRCNFSLKITRNDLRNTLYFEILLKHRSVLFSLDEEPMKPKASKKNADKRALEREVFDLKSKKERLECDTSKLFKSTDIRSEIVESLPSWSLPKSNTMRRSKELKRWKSNLNITQVIKNWISKTT